MVPTLPLEKEGVTMYFSEFPELTKWPRLIVVGENVTRQQASEILIRTNQWWLGTNDLQFKRSVFALAGIKWDGNRFVPDSCSLHAFERKIRMLDLQYLENNQIASAWIGGPHGWCDWNGYIGCSNYNIGKWPSVEDVHHEWNLIAEAFPYLRLTAQLIPNEGESEKAVVEWNVANGVARIGHPAQVLEPTDVSEDVFLSIVMDRTRERGVSLDRLQEALSQVLGDEK